MPYIKREYRPVYDPIVDLMAKIGVKADGDLNYILYKYCKYHIQKNYEAIKQFRDELLECWAEIGRRILAPYEDKKIKENGDI